MGKVKTVVGHMVPTGALAAVLAALKASGVIDWPWLWVVSPMWLPAAAVLTLAGVGVAVALVASAVRHD